MGWWPFTRNKDKIPDLIMKDTRTLLNDLQDICERNFDKPAEARRQIQQSLTEWQDLYKQGLISEDALDGMILRGSELLRCSDEEFSNILDNLEFWKPGWRPEKTNTIE